MSRQRLFLLPETLAVCRLAPEAPLPAWALAGAFASLTRTQGELSVVCPEGQVPPGVPRQEGWRALQVEGPLDFSLTGIVASLTHPLAREEVGVLVISTYDTDYLLVREAQLERAVAALRREGFEVGEDREG